MTLGITDPIDLKQIRLKFRRFKPGIHHARTNLFFQSNFLLVSTIKMLMKSRVKRIPTEHL